MNVQTNKKWWDRAVEHHKKLLYYDIEGFIHAPSKITLGNLEVSEIGEVKGLALLHLQCHMGLDTLSWQRLGANTVGVDFSSEAIEVAKNINTRAGLDASFLCLDVYDVPANVKKEFDIIFSSYGVLCWLKDLDAYAQVLNSMLRKGGKYYLAEIHPFVQLLESSDRIPYESDYEMNEIMGSYASEDNSLDGLQTYYIRKISDIVNALIKANFKIDFLHEFNYSTYRFHHTLKNYDYGLGLYKNPNVPLVYSVMATKL